VCCPRSTAGSTPRRRRALRRASHQGHGEGGG
jgi:hypothetical protein